MDIKLTEIVRATTISLNIKDAPMTALPLIKDAFAKLATDLEEAIDGEVRGPSGMTYKEAQKVRNAAASRLVGLVAGDAPMIRPWNAEGKWAPTEVAQTAGDVMQPVDEPPATEKPRRGRPKKVEEPAPAVEPTPLEQAIADVEDKERQGESGSAETADTPEATEVATVAEPVTDADLQKYCVRLAQHYGGPAKVFDFAKQFVEEGAVARPSNIKGDDKRWAFIRAVETDSGVKYHG